MNIEFTDGAGNAHKFGIYPLRSEFKAVGAVYAISRATIDRSRHEQHEILYIGQTDNLGERMKAHLYSSSWITPSGANRVCVLIVEDQILRSELEASLVKEYQPRYNTYLKELWL